MRLSDVDAIGFDMDHTLVRYIQQPFSELVFDCVRNFLVRDRCYADERVAALRFEVEFASKGIVFDRRLGNFIKLDAHKRVVRARHGALWLSAAAIQSAYHDDQDARRELEAFDGARTVRWLPFITAFDLPVCSLVAHLVDFIDAAIDERVVALQLPPVAHTEHDAAQYFFAPREIEAYARGGVAAAYERMLTDVFAGFNYSFSDFNRGEYVRECRVCMRTRVQRSAGPALLKVRLVLIVMCALPPLFLHHHHPTLYQVFCCIAYSA